MEACYIADPLLNAISFRGVGLDHTWTSSDSSAGTFVPLTDPEVEFVASRKVHQSSYQDGATIFYGPSVIRSEEHTSELQSLMRISYAVFCLKKKRQNQNHKYNTTHQQDIQAKK